jgi:excisionase family DNA binding protein
MADVNLNKDIFTTFEVAKICNANITSIKNWIEKGKLRAFRTPGGHYRVERAVLEDFLNRYAMPNPFSEKDRKSLLIVCRDPAKVELIRRGLGRNVEVDGTDSPLEAALLIGERRPNAVLLDFGIKGFKPEKLASLIRLNDAYKRLQIIGYLADLDADKEDKLREKGFNYFSLHDDELSELHAVVKESLV